MTEQPTESAPEVEESQASPKPVISATSEVQQASQATDYDLLADKLATKVLPVLAEMAKREAQSVKDKRFSAYEQDLDKLKAYLDAAGGDTRKAAREIAVDNLLASGSPSDPGRSSWQDWPGERDKILKGAQEDYGVKLEWNDPEVLAVAQGTYSSPADVVVALNKVVAKRQKQGSVSAASVASEGGGSARANDDVDTLTKKLAELRSSPDRKAYAEAADKLRKAMAEQGISVYQR